MSARVPVDHEVRQRAQCDVDRSLVVEASAGTGKTTLLVARVLNIVARRTVPIEKIVAITFTEKAAAELRVRIREALERAIGDPRGAWSADDVALFTRALADLALANISTIHAFASSLLRERPVEAHVDPGFAVLDPLNTTMMIDEVWSRWEERELLALSAPYHRVLAAGVKRDRVQALARDILVNRDLYTPLAYSDDRAFDFEEEARALAEGAAALEKRALAGCATEDDALVRVARALSADARAIVSSGETQRGALLAAMKTPRTGRLGNKTNWRGVPIDEMRAAVGAMGERVAAFRAGVATDVARWLGGFLAAYEEEKARRGVLDFTDLLLLARNLLRDHLHVRADFIARFDAILVDEFQDTDPLQAETVLFLSEAQALATDWRDVVVAPGRLFVVGDPKQSIYRFRRADLDVYEDVRDRVAGGAPLTITQNFRSVPGIAAWVNALFERLFEESADSGARIRYAPIVAERAASIAPPVLLLAPPPMMESGRSAEEVRHLEANAIAAAIAEGIDAGWARPRDVAMLFRALTDVYPYEDALDARGIPYQVEGGKAFFERQEVAAFLSCLAAVDDPEDSVALVAALRTPHFGISDEQLALLAADGLRPRYLDDPGASHSEIAEAFALLRTLHAERYDAPLHVVAERILERTRVLEFHALRGRGRRAVANLIKVVEKARAFESLGAVTLRAFVHWIAEEARESVEADSPIAEESDDLVSLVTIHSAKGLQYPVVALANLHGGKAFSDSFLKEARSGRFAFSLGGKDHPLRTARFDETRMREVIREREEGKRLLYVAATRARDALIIPAYGALLAEKELQKKTLLLDCLSGLPPRSEWRDGAVVGGVHVRVLAGDRADVAAAEARAARRGAKGAA
ncbi:MAG: UvrD-helicase domain-containing protein, partial [bacterium]